MTLPHLRQYLYLLLTSSILVSALDFTADRDEVELLMRNPFERRQDTNSSSSQGNCTTNNGLDPSTFTPPLYTESVRPQILYSPSSGFMNDPNGLVKSGDTWHIYYQYNPTALVAGNQHWGHATSRDLYTWTNFPPAIAPRNSSEGIFSGSAVLDVNNTSGFFNDSVPADSRFVAIYTLNTAEKEVQNIAYSSDGANYTLYENNPVIDSNTTQFRDPQVFWDARVSRWIMTVAYSQDFQIAFYSSTDLKSWREESRFGPAGILGNQYECPNLFPVPIQGGYRDGQMAWMLLVSINPGMPLGGSGVEYFFGDWNGTTFTPEDTVSRIADFGKDWYAPQVFNNGPTGQAITIGWASNWQYTNVVPTSPYRSTMSSPREMKLVWTALNPMKWGYQLAMQPYNLEAINSTMLTNTTDSANTTVALNGDGAFQIRANFSIPSAALTNATNGTNPTGEFRIFDTSNSSYLKVGFTFGNPIVVYVDRRFAGKTFADDNPYFTDRFSQQIQPIYQTANDTTSDQLMDMRIIVDRTVSEVFAQQGIASSVVLTYWDNESRPASVNLGLGDSNIKLNNLMIDSIPGTWPQCP